MMLTVQTITREEHIRGLAAEWARLDETLSPRTPFSSPAWCLTWWRRFRRASLVTRDELRLFALRDETGALVAVAPMMLTLRPGFGPLQARELQFFGADPYMTELRGPICRPERMVEVATALKAHLEAREDEWDWVQWRGLRTDGPGAEWPRELLSLEECDVSDNHFLVMPESWDDFRAALPRNIKESLRKCYNSLARDGIAFELRVAGRPEEAREALETFFRLHKARADTSGTIDHLDVFERPANRLFLLEYGEALAASGRLKVFQLVIGGEVVATRVGMALGDELYLYFSGYDPAWGKYSIMTTTLAEAIKWAIAERFAIVNLSTGRDVSKTRWRPRQAHYASGTQRSGAWRSELAYSSVAGLRRLAKR